MDGLGDFINPIAQRVIPSSSLTKFPGHPGPSNSPISKPDAKASTDEYLKRILNELINQSVPRKPILRSGLAADTGITLDWSSEGFMGRIMMRNAGPNPAWFMFDQNGSQVPTTTSQLSFKLQANEAISIERCYFQRIGFICTAGQTALINAIAFVNSGVGSGGIN